ncbi:MAG: hypothetical protein P4L43_10580 [Syntrophobacteraceae bacterium]|nr:hypothetical protein [Syntrophobacteraceae bacterium]
MHPIPSHISKLYLLVFILAVATFIAPRGARAQEGVLTSTYCTLYYSDQAQLDEFSSKIHGGAFLRKFDQILVGRVGMSNESDLAQYLDQLFKRVQLVLAMPLPGVRVEIRIHRSQEGVERTFAQLTGRSTNAPAFYWYRTNTIHIQTGYLTVGMLGHEMGHCILDHYFAIQPPVKIAEMLCHYVDRQLSSGTDTGGLITSKDY